MAMKVYSTLPRTAEIMVIYSENIIQLEMFDRNTFKVPFLFFKITLLWIFVYNQLFA